MRPPKRIKIGRQYWTIRHGDPGRNNDGVCLWDSREIIIARNLPRVLEIGTIVHEMLHPPNPDYTEDAIERSEYAVMEGLRWQGLFTEDD